MQCFFEAFPNHLLPIISNFSVAAMEHFDDHARRLFWLYLQIVINFMDNPPILPSTTHLDKVVNEEKNSIDNIRLIETDLIKYWNWKRKCDNCNRPKKWNRLDGMSGSRMAQVGAGNGGREGGRGVETNYVLDAICQWIKLLWQWRVIRLEQMKTARLHNSQVHTQTHTSHAVYP